MRYRQSSVLYKYCIDKFTRSVARNSGKFFLHKFRLGSDPEEYNGADVSENSSLNIFVELFNILMGNNQVETVFSSFGQNVGEALGRKVLKLVNVEEKIFSFFLEC